MVRVWISDEVDCRLVFVGVHKGPPPLLFVGPLAVCSIAPSAARCGATFPAIATASAGSG